MKFRFVPKRLIQSRDEVVVQHADQRTSGNLKDDENFKKLIERLVSLEEDQVKKNALVLTEKEIVMITKYLPHNYYGVEMEKLFKIVHYRSNRRLCGILYYEWQESYKNEDCNRYLRSFLRYNTPFLQLLKEYHFDVEKFADLLEESDVAYQLGKELQNFRLKKDSSLKERLDYLGIRSGSRLYKDCEFVFYTFCEKTDYIAAGEKELWEIVKKYNLNQFGHFLHNFLMKLNLKELQDFSIIAQFMNEKSGMKISHLIFSKSPSEIIEKYINWINLYKIYRYFGNDERSRFWKQYKFKEILFYQYSNAVVMEFEKYYAVEFLGYNMGPIYIYEKTVFEQSVKQWFLILNNAELRSKLYNSSELYLYRKAHQGYWQEGISEILKRRRIAEYLDI